MQLEIPVPTVTTYAQAARAHGVKVVLNAAPAQALPPELLNALDVLIVNKGELAAGVPHASMRDGQPDTSRSTCRDGHLGAQASTPTSSSVNAFLATQTTPSPEAIGALRAYCSLS